MPAYNGGLFEHGRSAILDRARISDAHLAPIIDALSRRTDDLLKARINYRDLSVTHLGGVYERLLEYRLEQEEGQLKVNKASFARKGSGSYYTHDALVRLILDEAVGRLLVERQTRFDQLLDKYRKKTELKPYEWDRARCRRPGQPIPVAKDLRPGDGQRPFSRRPGRLAGRSRPRSRASQRPRRSMPAPSRRISKKPAVPGFRPLPAAWPTFAGASSRPPTNTAGPSTAVSSTTATSSAA